MKTKGVGWGFVYLVVQGDTVRSKARQGTSRSSEARRIARQSNILWRTEDVVHRGVALVQGKANEHVSEMRKIKWMLKNKKGRGEASCTRRVYSYTASGSGGRRGGLRAA